MKGIKKIMPFFLLSLTANFLHAQNGEDCLSWLKKVYSSMEQHYKPSADKAFYLSYEVSTAMEDGTYSMTAELYSDEKKSWFISKEAEVYQDSRVTVSILPARKLIFINDFKGKDQKEAQIKHLSFIQDTLFQLSRVVFCENAKADDGKQYKKISLKLSPEGKKMFNVESLDFYADEKKEELKEVHVKYTPQQAMKEMKIRFNKMETAPQLGKLKDSLLNEVLDESGKLKPPYVGYKFSDERSKKIN
jgi:hypothetical protein